MRVLVLGLGRIGLPHAVAAASSGHTVYGYDIDNEYMEALRQGRVVFVDDFWGEYFRVIRSNLFLGLPDRPVDVVVLGFGSHPGEEDWASRVARILEDYRDIIRDAIVIVRGTVHVGETRRLSNYLHAKDWFKGEVYFAPERLVEGRSLAEEKSLPVIYGGPSRSRVVEEYFGKITSGGVRYVGEWEIAEAVKLVNNTWRAATFALANAIYLSLQSRGLDAFKIFEVAGWRYPRGKMPSPGYVSGYCLSKDPIIFDESIGLGRVGDILAANEDLIEYTVRSVRDAKRVLVLGFSYKWDVDDYRSTHARRIVERLLEMGKDVDVHDPYHNKGRYSIENKYRFIESIECEKYDAVIVSTPHSMYKGLKCNAPIIVDIWNILKQENTSG